MLTFFLKCKHFCNFYPVGGIKILKGHSDIQNFETFELNSKLFKVTCNLVLHRRYISQDAAKEIS